MSLTGRMQHRGRYGTGDAGRHRKEHEMKIFVTLLLFACSVSLCDAALPRLAMALQHLVSEPNSGSHLASSKPPPPDPEVVKKSAAVPRLNLKESWNRHKTTVIPRLRQGSYFYRIRKFVFSSIAKSKDFLLDNAGNIIYKSLPFVIALLHLPVFKKFTEGTPAIE